MVTSAGHVLQPDAHVLLIRMSALGDVLFALETLASLKSERPDVRVHFLVEDRFADLLRGHPQIDDLIVYPRRSLLAVPGHLLRLLWSRRFDAVIDLQGNLKSGLHLLFCRARVKVGFDRPIAREGAWRFYGKRVAVPEPAPHRADMGLFLLRALGLAAEHAHGVVPRIEIDPVWPQADGKRVVLHPGTSAFGAFKRWPIANFVDLAGRLTNHGIQVGVTAGPAEADLAQAVIDANPTVVRVRSDRGLRGLAAALAQADLVVAADTGPLHIAAALGKPVVALFGPKDPSRFYPRVARHVVLYHDVPCRPCTRRQCPSALCVRGVDVASVEHAIAALLGVDA